MIEDIIEDEMVEEHESDYRPRRNRSDFGWESLASIEQSRQNEIISEIYDMMSNPNDDKLKMLKAEWAHLPVDAEQVVAGFNKAVETYESRSKNIENALRIKKDLLNQAKMLEDNKNFKDTANRLKELQSQWKAAGFAGKDDDQTLWAEFRKANDSFFERRAAHFEEMNQQRSSAKEAKEALIEEVKELSDSTDWKTTSRAMNELMNRWKKAGFAGREVDDQLWEVFNQARQVFYSAQKVHFDELNALYDKARLKKEELVEKAQALVASANFLNDRGNMDALFEEWKAAGHSGRAHESKLWEAFKSAQDAFFNGFKAQESQDFETRRNVLEEEVERLDVRISALENLNAMIDIKLEALNNPSLPESVKEENKEEIEQLEASKEANNKNLDTYNAQQDEINRKL